MKRYKELILNKNLLIDRYSKNDMVFITGFYSGGGTPDPFSNSEVKSTSGHGTTAVSLRESSTMPVPLFLTK